MWLVCQREQPSLVLHPSIQRGVDGVRRQSSLDIRQSDDRVPLTASRGRTAGVAVMLLIGHGDDCGHSDVGSVERSLSGLVKVPAFTAMNHHRVDRNLIQARLHAARMSNVFLYTL